MATKTAKPAAKKAATKTPAKKAAVPAKKAAAGGTTLNRLLKSPHQTHRSDVF
ncbi:hypothetical protein [Caballeronia arvi]|uniref:hypothetical protein n=1 Tax=Caballeronia arvi TaxID=1777135 RepID=UPI00190EA6C6|nr:hypothetical protein [Caballeronia arvi]